MEPTQQKQYLIVSGRRFGKTFQAKTLLGIALSQCERVAIVDVNGIYCYNCSKRLKDCGFKCKDGQ